jgi:hypothetical protein
MAGWFIDVYFRGKMDMDDLRIAPDSGNLKYSIYRCI